MEKIKLNRDTLLADANGCGITYGNIVDALREIGIKSGDIVCVHSELLKFGRFQLPRDQYMQAYIDALLEVITEEGTLLMPTFSYSFCKGEIYDVQRTKSTVGVLTEYFRKLPYVKRNSEPIFSFAVCGKNADRYMEIGENCFSDDSVFGKLLTDKAKMVFMGELKGFTFNHYIEASTEVPYRYMKRFSGIVKDNEVCKESFRDYYVRKLDEPSITHRPTFIEYIKAHNIVKTSEVGAASISCMECDKWFESVSKQYRENPYYFLNREEEF